MQTYTVFDFNRDFYTETLNELGYHHWPTILFTVVLIVAAFLIFLSPALTLAIALCVSMTLGMFQLHKYVAAREHYNEHFNEKVRMAYLERQEEIDKGIDESLAKHDLTRDEACNQSTVLDSIERKPIDARETLLCGTNTDSALPGMFILDNHDAVVRMGESEGKVTVVYKPKN